MTLRRYSELKPSAGTRWPDDVARAIEERDHHRCVGPLVGMPGNCFGQPEKDHVRASGAVGMKSPSTVENGVLLCSTHHRMKTLEGRAWRPLLIAYIDRTDAPHVHVEPVWGCSVCDEIASMRRSGA